MPINMFLIKQSFNLRKIIFSLMISILGLSSTIAQSGKDWPCFHGSDRTNKSKESGLLKAWPDGGPELAWTISGIGEGYSSVIIANEHLYTEGRSGDMTAVFCFDLNGKLIWKKPCGKAWNTSLSWASSYIGSRSTPTYSEGMLYILGEAGLLEALDSETGKELWSRELTADFNASIPEYGYSESVLIDGDKLYVRPFGKKAYQVCLNKKNGNIIWATNDNSGKEGYASFVINDFGGFRQLITSTGNTYYGLDAKTGSLLWKVDFANQRELNVSDAVTYNDYVFVSSGYGKGCMLFKLKASGKGITTEKAWESDLMDNHHGGVLLHNGYLYGSGTNKKEWFCLDFASGKKMWNIRGKGSLTYADGMLYLLDEKGTMKLVKADPGKYECTGEFTIPKGGESFYWAHPVVCGGRLYIRHSDKIFAYDIKAR
jgi:outer membrane protein assembly factor BamB